MHNYSLRQTKQISSFILSKKIEKRNLKVLKQLCIIQCDLQKKFISWQHSVLSERYTSLKPELHLLFPYPYSCPSSVPVSVILIYTLQRFLLRYLTVLTLLGEIIHSIHEKWRQYDVSTICVRHKKGSIPSHPWTTMDRMSMKT